MRPIDISTFNTIEARPGVGAAPQLQWIDIAQLVVDDGYQRPLTSQSSRTNIRRIAERFNWRRFAPVIVSPIEGGFYAIIDGQHRTHGAALRGIRRVPCNVVIADQQEQAEAFEAINGQVTRVSNLQIFKARLAAGEPEARRIATVVASAGVRLVFSNRSVSQMEPGETLALDAITRMMREFGDGTVRIVLIAILASAKDRSGYLSGPIIAALTIVLGDHKEWLHHPQLGDVMAGLDLRALSDRARAQAAMTRGVTVGDSLQAALITLLDRALPDAKAPA